MTARRQTKIRCKARTKEGKRCQAFATATGLCFFHGNPSKASELGRVGGRAKRHHAVELIEPLPLLKNVVELRDGLARVICETYSGELPLRVGVVLGPLFNSLIRAVAFTDVEERVRMLEEVNEKFELSRMRAEVKAKEPAWPPIEKQEMILKKVPGAERREDSNSALSS